MSFNKNVPKLNSTHCGIGRHFKLKKKKKKKSNRIDKNEARIPGIFCRDIKLRGLEDVQMLFHFLPLCKTND